MEDLSTHKKYLPLGSIVLLKNGKKRVMITGFCLLTPDKNKVYDYAGCIYPEGMLSSTRTFLFDHDQIQEIYFLGFQDEEEKEFKQKLNETMQQYNEKKKSSVENLA